MPTFRSIALVTTQPVGSDEALAQARARADARNRGVALLGRVLQHHAFLLLVERQQAVAHGDEIVDDADSLEAELVAQNLAVNHPGRAIGQLGTVGGHGTSDGQAGGGGRSGGLGFLQEQCDHFEERTVVLVAVLLVVDQVSRQPRVK